MTAETSTPAVEHTTLPEPPDGGLIGLFDAPGGDVPLIYERDDTSVEVGADDRWYGVDDGESYRYADVLNIAETSRREMVRLYRADDLTHPGFAAGVEAAAKTVEAYAESIDWYEAGRGVWAEAIEKARGAAERSQP